jgi:hypothetical protein
MEDVGIFYERLVYFAAIWYSLCPFGIIVIWYIFLNLVCCTKKHLKNPPDLTISPPCFYFLYEFFIEVV